MLQVHCSQKLTRYFVRQSKKSHDKLHWHENMNTYKRFICKHNRLVWTNITDTWASSCKWLPRVFAINSDQFSRRVHSILSTPGHLGTCSCLCVWICVSPCVQTSVIVYLNWHLKSFSKPLNCPTALGVSLCVSPKQTLSFSLEVHFSYNLQNRKTKSRLTLKKISAFMKLVTGENH